MHDDRFNWEADKPCEGFTITFKKGREQEFARIYINIKMSKSVEKLKFSMSIQNLQPWRLHETEMQLFFMGDNS